MARNNPVASWRAKQKASRDPKFHQYERAEGEGRSIRAPLITEARGCLFFTARICPFKSLQLSVFINHC